MFTIGQAIIDESVRDARFACDLTTCKGACCCLPGARGAPLEDDEVLEIQKAYPAIRSMLPPASIATVETEGMVEGGPGDYATRCVGYGDCAYVYRDNGVAKCAFERAFIEGRTDWRKPISCHLFPIRIRPLEQDVIRYEQIPECQAGRTRGENENIPLVQFVREAILMKYGSDWYERLRNWCLPSGTV
jgi:hypothetical protein